MNDQPQQQRQRINLFRSSLGANAGQTDIQFAHIGRKIKGEDRRWPIVVAVAPIEATDLKRAGKYDRHLPRHQGQAPLERTDNVNDMLDRHRPATDYAHCHQLVLVAGAVSLKLCSISSKEARKLTLVNVPLL